MRRIQINETFYSITKEDPLLRNAFIDMGFKPMSDDRIYQTVGRTITLQKALAHIKMDIPSVNAYLKSKNLEVEVYE